MAKKQMPRTGQPRKTRQPFSIDVLPMDVLESIKRLRAQHGLSWQEIERLSSLPYNDAWEARANFGKYGFINWDELATRALEAFPGLRLPASNLHRWYDVTIVQKQAEIEVRAAHARELARSFAEAGMEGADEAVENALRDLIFGMMQEQSSDEGRAIAAKYLLGLRDVMNGAKANAIKERKVATEERRVDLLEKKLNLVQKKSAVLAGELEQVAATGKPPDLKQLAAKVREIYGA